MSSKPGLISHRNNALWKRKEKNKTKMLPLSILLIYKLFEYYAIAICLQVGPLVCSQGNITENSKAVCQKKREVILQGNVLSETFSE